MQSKLLKWLSLKSNGLATMALALQTKPYSSSLTKKKEIGPANSQSTNLLSASLTTPIAILDMATIFTTKEPKCRKVIILWLTLTFLTPTSLTILSIHSFAMTQPSLEAQVCI